MREIYFLVALLFAFVLFPPVATLAQEEPQIEICAELDPPRFVIQPDIIETDGQGAVFLDRAIWDQKLVKVSFLDGDEYFRDKVKRFAPCWSMFADLQFDFVPSNGDIRITFTRGGSWSHIGSHARNVAPDKPTMQFGWFTSKTTDEEFRRTIVHEFGHAIGLVHEHQHPTAPIQWNRRVALDYFKRMQGWTEEEVQRNVFDRYAEGVTNSKYDSRSIMHYAIPAALTENPNSAVPWNNVDLSTTDRRFASFMYPYTGKPVSRSRIHFFRGGKYERYQLDSDSVDLRSRRIIAGNSGWKDLPEQFHNGIDAAVYWGTDHGYVYFFKGDKYVRWNTKKGKPSTPVREISQGWPGLRSSGIDAALNMDDGRVFFFQGDEYVTYDIETHTMIGNPRKISDDWRGVWERDIDAVVNKGNGRIYFFKGSSYKRYQKRLGEVDKTEDDLSGFTGLSFDRVDAALELP